MILRNVAVSWLAIAISQIIALVITPLLIHYLGEENFGVWYLLVSVSYLLASLDLGLSSALVRHVSARLARGDQPGALRLTSTCLSLFTMQGLLVALCYLVLWIWLDAFFAIPPQTLEAARWVLVCLCASTVVSLPARVFGGLLAAKERYDVAQWVEVLVYVLRFGLILWVLNIGGGLVAVGVVHAGLLLMSYLLHVWFALRLVDLGGRISFGWHQADAKAAMTYGGDTILMNLGDRIRDQLPVWLLGAWADPVAVARYGVGNRLLANQTVMVRQSAQVARPRYSALEAKGDQSGLADMLLRMALYSGLAACYIGGGLALLGGSFIMLWVGPDFALSVSVLYVLVGPVTLALSLFACDTLLVGIGKHRITGLVSMAEALVVIGLAWPLIRHYGVVGGAMAGAGALLVLRPWVIPAYACKQAGLGLMRYWLAGPLRALAALALPMGLSVLLLHFWPVDSWLGLIAAGLLYTALCLPAVWFWALDTKERRFWKEKIRALVMRIRRPGEEETKHD